MARGVTIKELRICKSVHILIRLVRGIAARHHPSHQTKMEGNLVILFLLSLMAVSSEARHRRQSIAVQKPSYFSDEWMNYYDEEHLAVQPKWQLADVQPEGGLFEIRDYPSAWWATSYTPCLNQTVATTYGYLKLYLYFHKYNYQRFGYPLTYPILTKAELNDGSAEYKEKNRVGCLNKFSQNLFVPIGLDQYPAATPDSSVSTELIPNKRYYVLRYDGDFYPESCTEHAGKLGEHLTSYNVTFNPYTWYCAQYKAGGLKAKALFEVWFEAKE